MYSEKKISALGLRKVERFTLFTKLWWVFFADHLDLITYHLEGSLKVITYRESRESIRQLFQITCSPAGVSAKMWK